MTIIDYDRRQKSCPRCNQEALVFITVAPKMRPDGGTVQYRCKPCAIQEAEGHNDPLEVIRHGERRALIPAWETGIVSAYHPNACRVGKGVGRNQKLST